MTRVSHTYCPHRAWLPKYSNTLPSSASDDNCGGQTPNSVVNQATASSALQGPQDSHHIRHSSRDLRSKMEIPPALAESGQ